jgi:hypothetical protein
MSNYDEVRSALEKAQSLAGDAYDLADSAESYANDASSHASRASDAINDALEELAKFQPFDSNELERLMEIQFALINVLEVNARRINNLVNGEEFTYSEVLFLRYLHPLLVNLTTRGTDDILVYSDRITEFENQYITTDDVLGSKYGRAIKYYVDKKEATNVQG